MPNERRNPARTSLLIGTAIALFLLAWARELLKLPHDYSIVLGLLFLIPLFVMIFAEVIAWLQKWSDIQKNSKTAMRTRGMPMAIAFLIGAFVPSIITSFLWGIMGTVFFRSSTFIYPSTGGPNLSGWLVYLMIQWGPLLIGMAIILWWPNRVQPSTPRQRLVQVRRKRASTQQTLLKLRNRQSR
jgi:uncharacterized membrane protein (DUF485 family)